MTATNILVSPDVKVLLPDVLIDYLWKLALSDQYLEYAVQTFTLSPGELSGQSTQDIFHLDTLRRVFGVEPVSCKLRVVNSEDQYQMILAN